ncbi:MAG: hypothetical protein GTO63_07320 [Anaerolineae bacterium]|nr:hypothetical protein [Anaerolineae bacterium]
MTEKRPHILDLLLSYGPGIPENMDCAMVGFGLEFTALLGYGCHSERTPFQKAIASAVKRDGEWEGHRFDGLASVHKVREGGFAVDAALLLGGDLWPWTAVRAWRNDELGIVGNEDMTGVEGFPAWL